MIRTVVFDIDNTLFDNIGLDRIVVHEILVPYMQKAFGWSEPEYRSRLEEATEAMIAEAGCNGSCRNRIIRFQRMMEKAGFPVHPHVLEMYRLYWDGMFSRMTPYEGAETVMTELKSRGIRIGIGSDMTAEIQYRKLSTLGLIRYVDFMVTSEEAGMEKPDERFFRLCLKKAQCTAQECLFVGDVIAKDYIGAKVAGMQAVWFNSRSLPHEPGIPEITRLDEILKL